MKKFIKKRTLILILICIAGGFYGGYKFYKTPSKILPRWNVVDAKDTSKKFMTKETLIKEIQKKQKLIITEVTLNETVTIDNSWGDIAAFKKVKNIKFEGKGIYTVDLSKLTSDNILLDSNKKSITLHLDKPAVEMITFDEDKTEYESTQNGLLRFGELKLKPEEVQTIEKRVKDNMKQKMLEDEYLHQASENTKNVLISMVSSIIGNDNYEINISFN